MPLLEVLQSTRKPVSVEQKRAFARSVVEICRDILGTPDGRLKIFFYQLGWEDGIEGLLEPHIEADDDSPG
jgi:hypothetical protein